MSTPPTPLLGENDTNLDQIVVSQGVPESSPLSAIEAILLAIFHPLILFGLALCSLLII